MSKFRLLSKFAATFGVGASAGYFYAVSTVEEYLIKPPTFANLEPANPIVKPGDLLKLDWGPVVEWDDNWDQRHQRVIC